MTLTTEQLREIMCVYGNKHPCYLAAAECLANREAQPVLYASEETLAYAKEGKKSLVTWSEPMGDAVIPLFTVATAQTSGVVNLPTEFICDEGVMVRLEQVMAALALVGVKYERRGEACRAAMLAQPVSSGYTLPEGWIACSERMPEIEDEYYLTFSASPFGGGVSVDFFFDGYFADQNITHWMPLPAAPEGGNG